MSNLEYRFFPCVRRGFAAALGGAAAGARASINLKLTVEAGALDGGAPTSRIVERPVEVYGPGDVLGIAARAFVRTDPVPGASDFEPNFFPAVELAEPDLPWRFTADQATATGRLTPWITLIVLIAEDRGQDLRREMIEGAPPADKLPGWIRVASSRSLPNLDHAWRWAHVQLSGGGAAIDATELSRIAALEPERLVSRLVCPRRLRPRTRYDAFVVPTFELGRAAGRGVAAAAGTTASTLAWNKAGPNVAVELPYYYRWSFVSSERGDFESLIRLLEPRGLSNLGVRAMNAERPGYGLPSATILKLEGALQSVDTSYSRWGRDPIANGPHPIELFQVELAGTVLNQPSDGLVQQSFTSALQNAPPDISDVNVTLLPEGDAVQIRWSTASSSSSRIDYGVTASFGYSALISVALRNHLMVLRQLDRGRTYHFRIQAVDSTGNVIHSPTSTFSLPGLPNVVPPIHGRWHRARDRVAADASHDRWLDVLNLDPRHRAAAGLGAWVVERNQEPLMASAWDQLGDAPVANDIFRRAMLGREIGRGILQRFANLSVEELLRVTRSLHDRVTSEDPAGAKKTVRARISDQSLAPAAAFDPSFRRIAARRRPLRKRASAAPRNDTLRRLMKGELRGAGPAPSPSGTYTLCDVTADLAAGLAPNGPTPGVPGGGPLLGATLGVSVGGNWTITLGTSGARTRRDGAVIVGGNPLPPEVVVTFPGEDVTIPGRAPPDRVLPDSGRFCEERIDCPRLDERIALDLPFDRPGVPQQASARAGVCAALDDWLTGRDAAEPRGIADANLFSATLRTAILDQLNPEQTIVARAKAQVAIDPNAARAGDPLGDLLFAPEFPQPMYEPLKELSQDHVLPGLQTIPDNTAALVETNGRFVESYLVGLNHALAGELLWREYPTDQRGSYFRQFWDVSAFVKNEADVERFKDIARLHEWGDNKLGENDNRARQGNGEQLVLLVRGQLLRRYPNTVIYAVPSVPKNCQDAERVPALPEYLTCANAAEVEATLAGAQPIFPVFSGTLEPDITFLGFPFDEATARDNQYFFVFEERVGEVRFGLDVTDAAPPALATWLEVGWYSFNDAAGAPLAADVFLDDSPSQPAPADPEGRVWSADASSATRAWITMQRPVRIAIAASRMLP